MEIDDLLRLTAPRPMFVVSASEDPYSRDAGELAERASPAYVAAERPEALEHLRYGGGHALTRERLDRIVEWLVETGRAPP